MKNVLFIVQRGPYRASSIKRVYELLPFLKRRGFNTKVLSLRSPIVNWLHYRRLSHPVLAGIPQKLGQVSGVTRRIERSYARSALRQLVKQSSWASCIVIQKEILPEQWIAHLKKCGKRLIFDLDDAVWLADSGVDTMLRLADQIVVSNANLHSFAAKYSAPVYRIPTGVDIGKYARYPRDKVYGREHLCVGWIGSPSGVPYLKMLTEPLSIVGNRRPLRLHIVGTGGHPLPDFHNVSVRLSRSIPYDPVEFVPQFDIGVMPLPDSEWERAKSGAKLLEYMAASLPVVCSPVGINASIIKDEQNGLWARNTQEWVAALDRLAGDERLRVRLGSQAFQDAKACFSMESIADRWKQVLEECAE